MSSRSLLSWVALVFLVYSAPARAQSVGSFDDPDARAQSGFPAQTVAPPAPPPSSQPPARTASPVPAAPAAPASSGLAYPTQTQQPAASPASSYVLSPPVLPYREGIDPPRGYVLEKHRNRGLMMGGGLTFAGAYGVSLIYALTKSFDNGTGWLLVPVVGPWGAIKGREFSCKSDNNVSQEDVDKCVDRALNEVSSITFLAVAGLVQAVGATLFFVGVGDVTEEWVRADLAHIEVEANVGPMSDGYGFTLSGRF